MPEVLVYWAILLAASPAPAVVDEHIRTATTMLEAPRAQVMILGTFHFDDAGLDEYKPKHDVDVRSPERRKELERLVDDLARFNPTHVAVEWPKAQQQRGQKAYDLFSRGEVKDDANEVYQIGFRLADRLKHDTVHLIDVKGRHYQPPIDRRKEARKLGVAGRTKTPWYDRYEKVSRWEDELKTRVSLQEFLLYLNDERRVNAGHGVYLVGGFNAIKGDAYPGPDHASGWWYNRNLRIFANILELIDSPDDRVLVIIGAGHLPILRHAAQASPEVELVEPRSYIRIAD